MKSANVPVPSSDIIKEYLNLWETLEDGKKYPLQEKALNFLFSEACPSNDDMTHVILKVSALNDFYSTNIFDTYVVADRILRIENFNDRLQSGDHSLVNEVAKVSIKGKEKNFYSFASKYCSHHCPNQFPIYDYYVEKMLLYYNNHSQFMAFKQPDLKTYENFLVAIQSFQKRYNLESFSLRDIDVFLWQAGKKYFPKSYGKKKSENKVLVQGGSDRNQAASASFNDYLIKKLNSGTIELFRGDHPISPVLPELKRIAGLLDVEVANSEGNPYNTRQLGDIIIKNLNDGAGQDS